MTGLARSDKAFEMRESPAVSSGDEPAVSETGSFARGLLIALPLSLVAWLVFFWLV
jgi:hypothetical protein